jgi:hypothetical protein
MSDSTRIADLPENNATIQPSYAAPPQPPQHHQPPSQQQMPIYIQGLDVPVETQNYVQMNIHPNPYGHGPPQHGGLGMPQQTHTTRPSNNPYIVQNDRPPHLAHLPQHQLPSRDIPQDTIGYTNDEEITANYIPAPPKSSVDFVKEYEETQQRRDRGNRRRDRAVRSLEEFLSDVRVPVIIGILFFLFQLPLFNRTLIHYVPNIVMEDGLFSVYGLLLKSGLFGLAYYSIEKGVAMLNDL